MGKGTKRPGGSSKRYSNTGGNRPPGGGGGGTKGRGVKGGSNSSSSVHDGIRILVLSMAAGVAIVVAGVAGFIVWGYAA